MSDEDVYGFEMDAPFPHDDAAIEALLSGKDHAIDPALADLVADMRVAYTSEPAPAGAALAAFLGAGEGAPQPSSRRFARMKSSILAKVGAATAVALAATGGLAMASALPAPMQNAVSHLGVGAPAHHGHGHGTQSVGDKSDNALDDSTTTTTDASSSSSTSIPAVTTTSAPANHGGTVSAVAHSTDATGCEHGRAVSAVASDGKASTKACPSMTTTTTVDETTTTLGETTTTTAPGHANNGVTHEPPANPGKGHGNGAAQSTAHGQG